MPENSYFAAFDRIAAALEALGAFRNALRNQVFDFSTDDGARAIILFVDAANDAGCTVEFTGAAALYTTDWPTRPRIEKGKRIFSIMEIADNEYLIETRELEEIGKD